ncbi:hypothetical protein LMG28614_04197 [Paraburkholderia ultramafica]|uniref:Uncharacterized protein n=1 Tax=Paraburkholderia ultramafica TaxID=1544867 RepID=A0A6S7BCI8_9BURK|nr:hypothetical protein [Paraburkholderia ultramafica]CAB3795546.1 hypothetical protein LMG28614_04197 [Paraburkholderia ultramafica]
MTGLDEPSCEVLIDLLKRLLIARIRLDAADVFDEALNDYCESEIKLCLSMLDTLLAKSPRAYAFLEHRLDETWGAARAAARIGPTELDIVCPSLKDLGLAKPD